ncbi:MAG: M48 family metallopeptidase [Prevotellaceae bacterium]|jgi:predicted Zn-dependent protease|nr:M48 family metallopeptidase [Prevotellaceae bacterium]
MKLRNFLFTIFIATVCVACTTVALTGRKQLSLVSDSQILAMSAASYSDFIKESPLSTDQTKTAMVKRVGSKIASAVVSYMNSVGRAADIADYQWEYNLVQSDDVNAFCMPGGKIVVYTGILPVTQSENGLAVVLGHEIAHAVARHSSEQMSQQVALEAGSSVISGLLGGASQTTQNIVGTVYGLTGSLGTLKFSRQHEYEADHMGLVFMAMAGYDPNGAVTFWQRMAQQSGGSSFELLSTHPSDAKRIAEIQKFLPEALQYYKK